MGTRLCDSIRFTEFVPESSEVFSFAVVHNGLVCFNGFSDDLTLWISFMNVDIEDRVIDAKRIKLCEIYAPIFRVTVYNSDGNQLNYWEFGN